MKSSVVLWLFVVSAGMQGSILGGSRQAAMLSLRLGAPDPAEVKHKKQPGGGYERGSPLFHRQEERAAAKQSADTAKTTEWMSTSGSPADNPWAPKPELEQSCLDPPPPIGMISLVIVTVASVYFILFAALAAARSAQRISGRGGTAKALEAAVGAVDLAPMLCLVFLAVRIRALQLSQGRPSLYHLPPDWVHFSMWICVLMLVARVALVLMCVIVSGRIPDTGESDNMLVADSLGYHLLTVARHMASLALILGGICVAVGGATMKPPASLWGDGAQVPLTTGVICIFILAGQVFVVSGVRQIFLSFSEMVAGRKGIDDTKTLLASCNAAMQALRLAPAFSILILACRLRAMQMNIKHGNPQAWAQALFYVGTAAITLHALLSFAMPTGGLGDNREVKRTSLSQAAFAFRAGLMFLLFLCSVAIFFAILWLNDPKSDREPPPPSRTLGCIVALLLLYFVVYTINLITTMANVGSRTTSSGALMSSAALNAVVFVPMVCILMLVVRSRGLQITAGQGSAPLWIHIAMILIAVLIALQTLLVFVVQAVTGSTPVSVQQEARGERSEARVFEDGGVEVQGPRAATFDVLRYVLMFGLYGCIAAMIAGVFIMDCRTANGALSMGDSIPFATTTQPVGWNEAASSKSMDMDWM
mmetsp:Transcript_19791/g.48093  ORF Transcript_19791/g.48093 Transcript_19791/m.48093 type:complete len:648 (+) Transcript_19791:88-2031(+)